MQRSPVCVRSSHTNATWRPYLFPRGHGATVGACPPASISLRVPRSRGCLQCRANEELGVDDAWLPVVHTRDRKHDTAGLWLYYARGCSDIAWHVGRTLRVRNRVHAAIALEQIAHGGSEQAAVRRVAEWVQAHHPRWQALERARHYLKRAVSIAFKRGAYGRPVARMRLSPIRCMLGCHVFGLACPRVHATEQLDAGS